MLSPSVVPDADLQPQGASPGLVHYRLSPHALQEIVEGTTAETGERFFEALVLHLSRAIGTRCAWVTEWLEAERRLRALAFWDGDAFVADFEYAVAGTPCEPVVRDRRLILIPDRVVELYRDDDSLEPLGAVSYLGVPLLDTDGRLLGHLAVLHDAPLVEDEATIAVFRIFAGRAAAELRRVRRDRTLHEREQKLTRLIESAMDAIVEIDDAERVTSLNPAAKRLFAPAEGDLALTDLLAPASREKVVRLIGELDRRPGDRQALWIPDGIEGRGASGDIFPAEATLSRYRVGDRSYHTIILRNVLERVAAEERILSLLGETAYLRGEIDALQGFDEIVGESSALMSVLADLERVAVTDATVLITGETGTGKELIARAIHRRSARAEGPLVTVNCAALPDNLQESELFGHEKGAFTGALQRRDGRFTLAHGGTIFLDEVGEMGPDLQAKLLRVLQEGEFEPVGSTRTVRVNVRVVTATNRDLVAMAREGSFRLDLMYRLNVFPLHLPALRERGDDVILLARKFAAAFARQRGRTPPVIGPEAQARLRRYDWPGNVRELQNVIERASITSLDPRVLDLQRALPVGVLQTVDPLGAAGPVDDARVLTAIELRDLEHSNMERALAAAGGRVSGPAGAAALLGLAPSTLASRMRALGIARPQAGS
jgi:PAS domain S-box-containing protein